jgi:TetR/AcrR family transcriptional regulator, lmrAB and yxaGH operons repressor
MVRMPPALLSREQVVERLMRAIRRFGYDGASLAELSKATGLGKSSLYHYFPAGKDDMVRAVLDHLEDQLRETLFVPLRAPGPVRERLAQMVETLDEFYRGGREACVLGNLVLGTSRTRFRRQLASIFEQWIDAIAAALVDGGVSAPLARARAEDAVLRIEGALILAGAMNDVAYFGRSLQQMPGDLLAPAPARR